MNKGEYKKYMKDKSFTVYHGLIIYVILSLIDKYIFGIPDSIFIPILIIGILMIIYDFMKNKSS